MAGKGDRNRVRDMKRFRRNFDRIKGLGKRKAIGETAGR